MNQWLISALVVNAFYASVANTIVFTAAFLRSPIYSPDEPEYMKYGGIGSVIGHEITHGFDSAGRFYDKNGNLRLWWPSEDYNEFDNKAKCYVDQYSNYIVPGTNMTINGIFTLGENIADNGGIKSSYKAYRKWVKTARNNKEEDRLPGLDYTPDQLFFLSFAQSWCANSRTSSKINQILTDVHSYEKFRVIGSLQNLEEFSRVWDCPSGSYMNPVDKCYLW